MKVSVTIQEIYDLMCPECREKLEGLVTAKLRQAAVKEALGGKDGKQKPS